MNRYLAISIAYLFAIGIAYAVFNFIPSYLHLLWKVLIADLAGTLVIFAFSRIFDNTSFYDPYWSVAPPIIAAAFIVYGTAGALGLRAWLILGLAVLYAIRLTHNFLRGWPDIKHEDWRYNDFRKQSPKLYWLGSLAGFHIFPTIMVFLGCLPMYAAIVDPSTSFAALDIIAALVVLTGIGFEFFADNQLRDYVLNHKKPGETFQGGLWKYSRHPNYFGENLVWLGFFLFGIAANPSYWWTGIGVVAMLTMFIFASLPLIDKRMLKRRPDYAAYKSKTSAIIPMPPKKLNS